MILIKSTIALLLCWQQGGSWAFAPQQTTTTTKVTSSSSALYISSWGTKGPPAFRTATKKDPEKYVQDYLSEPEPVEARDNIDGTCLVSGVCNAQDRTDQFLFDLLNHEDSAFEFTKIIAFVKDTAFSKKRLLSRSARYTGLLDKLDFIQGDTFPTTEQLDGVKSWVAVLENDDGSNTNLLDKCNEIINIVTSASTVENIAILLTNANELDATQCQAVVDKLKTTNKQYTIVAVGKLEERPEGKTAYHYGTFGAEDAVLPSKAVFSREESYRMITELLQLECGNKQVLTFAELYNVNATESKLIRGLREAGYARPQEIDHMIRKGPKAYTEAIENWKKENPDAAKGYTTNAWWEAEEYQKSRRKSDEKLAKELEAVKDERTKEIEGIAKEWVKREYFRLSMEGTIDMSEDEFNKLNWTRAMEEGEMRYKQIRGEITDDEYADFKKLQERKQEAMLIRAKKELQAILDEEDLGGDDIKDKLSTVTDDKNKPAN